LTPIFQKPCARKYVAHGWLEQVARGVYRRPVRTNADHEGLRWQPVVISLQTLLGYPFTNESKHVSASLPNAGVGLALLSFKRVAEPCGKPLAEPFNHFSGLIF
jgi:hypothetical protein